MEKWGQIRISDLTRISLTPTLGYVTFCQLQIEEMCHGCEIPLILFKTGKTFISWTCGNLLSFAFMPSNQLQKNIYLWSIWWAIIKFSKLAIRACILHHNCCFKWRVGLFVSANDFFYDVTVDGKYSSSQKWVEIWWCVRK